MVVLGEISSLKIVMYKAKKRLFLEARDPSSLLPQDDINPMCHLEYLFQKSLGINAIITELT